MEPHRRLTRTKLWIIVIPITTFRFPFCAFELAVASCTPLVAIMPFVPFVPFVAIMPFVAKKVSKPLSYPFII